MDRLLRIFNKEYEDINKAAFLLGFFAFLSQVLALFRDRSIAHFIGPNSSLDMYYAAFRVPDLIFISVASLASITVIIPFVVAKMKGDQVTEEASKFLNDVFSVFFIMMVFVSLLAFLFMPYLVSLVVPGFNPEMQVEVIKLSRIMLLSPVLLGLSNLFGAVTQIFRRFFIYSLSPIFYNIGIIVGVIFLYPTWGIMGLVFGVVFGAFLHFIIQALASISCEFTPRFSRSINFKEIWQVSLTSLPRTLGLTLNNVALIFIVALASYLHGGSISIFNFSFNLQSVPLNIIGVSYAVAAFPTLARSVSLGKMKEFRDHLKSAARAMIFWSLPITFLFIVLRAQIVRVILGSGSFSWDNTRLVAASLAIFSVSVLSQGMIALLSRAYYAMGNTRRPLMINLLSSVSIVLLSFFFLHIFENVLLFRYFIESMLKVSNIPGTEVLMLPLAYSAGTILNFVLFWFFIKKDFMNHKSFMTKTFFQSLGASFFVGAVAYVGLNVFSPIFGTTTFLGVFFQGFLSGIFGIMAGILVLHLLDNQELKEVIDTLRSKFWRTKMLPPPQDGI